MQKCCEGFSAILLHSGVILAIMDEYNLDNKLPQCPVIVNLEELAHEEIAHIELYFLMKIMSMFKKRYLDSRKTEEAFFMSLTR